MTEAASSKGPDWDASFAALATYGAAHGHTRVPQQFRTDDGYWLGKWVHNQRQRYRAGRMPEDLIARIETLPGWAWSARRLKADAPPPLPGPTARALKAASDNLTGTRPPTRIHGTADLAAFLTAHTHDISKHMPRHPLHPNLRATVLELRRSRDRLGYTDVQLLETVPGWTWNDNQSEDFIWWHSYDVLRKHAQKRGSLNISRDVVSSRGVVIRDWLNTQRAHVQIRPGTAGALPNDRRNALMNLPGWSDLTVTSGQQPSVRERMSDVQFASRFPERVAS